MRSVITAAQYAKFEASAQGGPAMTCYLMSDSTLWDRCLYHSYIWLKFMDGQPIKWLKITSRRGRKELRRVPARHVCQNWPGSPYRICEICGKNY